MNSVDFSAKVNLTEEAYPFVDGLHVVVPASILGVDLAAVRDRASVFDFFVCRFDMRLQGAFPCEIRSVTGVHADKLDPQMLGPGVGSKRAGTSVRFRISGTCEAFP